MSINPSLLEQAKALNNKTVKLRRKIHRNPELGLHLPKTRSAVLEFIDDLDLDIALSENNSGIVAVLHGDNPGPTILLRGDMDALPMPEETGLPYCSEDPNLMHACGHDAHTAMLASAAHLLHSYKKNISGSVLFMFQPGEEGPGGAKPMLEEGLLHINGVPQAAYALHVEPELESGLVACRSGPILAACDTIFAKILGKGGHGSAPHNAIDPVPIACEVVQAIQTMVTRQFDVFDPVVATVGRIQAGTVSNVIPQFAELDITLRSLSQESRQRLAKGVENLVTQIPMAHGLEVSLEIEYGYPPTINHSFSEKNVAAVAKAVLGEDKYVEMAAPQMGGEDFSYILENFAGAFAFLGVASPDVPMAPCHSTKMQIDEGAMAAGVAMYAALALHDLQK